MITYSQLEETVRTQFEAESTTRWESDAFLSAANDGLDELAEATLFYERSVNIPLRAKQTYYDLREYVPDDAVSINAIFNPENGIWLTPIGIRDLKVQKWETVPGSPQKYIFRGLFWLGIYPRPSTEVGNIRLYYSGLTPDLSNAYSVLPSDLPDDFSPAVEEYMLYDLNVKDGETDRALEHWNRYQAREKALWEFVRERMVRSRSGALSRQTRP